MGGSGVYLAAVSKKPMKCAFQVLTFCHSRSNIADQRLAVIGKAY